MDLHVFMHCGVGACQELCTPEQQHVTETAGTSQALELSRPGQQILIAFFRVQAEESEHGLLGPL